MEPRVLVVDDEPDFVELMTHGLGANGFECASACTGLEGLEKARAFRPDAILLDVMLPDLDGFTVCEMFRRQPATERVPVLMLTCLGGTMSRFHGLAAGADDYLTKPLKMAELISHLRVAIERRARLSPPAAG